MAQNRTEANFEFSRLSHQDFLEIQEDQDKIVRKTFQIKDRVIGPKEVPLNTDNLENQETFQNLSMTPAVTIEADNFEEKNEFQEKDQLENFKEIVSDAENLEEQNIFQARDHLSSSEGVVTDADNLEEQIERSEQLLEEIRKFLPNESEEDQSLARIKDYDSASVENIDKTFSDELFHQNSPEVFEQNYSDENFHFIPNDETSSEFVLNNDFYSSLADNLNFIESSGLPLEQDEFGVISQVPNNKLPVDYAPLLQKSQENTDFLQKNLNFQNFLGRDFYNERRNKFLAGSLPLPLEGENLYSREAESSIGHEIKTENDSLIVDYLDQQLQNTSQDKSFSSGLTQNVSDREIFNEEKKSLEDVNGTDQNDFGEFDPSSFKLPTFNIPELNFKSDSVHIVQDLPRMQGLLRDNKTATFIFVSIYFFI